MLFGLITRCPDMIRGAVLNTWDYCRCYAEIPANTLGQFKSRIRGCTNIFF